MKDVGSSALESLGDGTGRVTLADCAGLRPCTMIQFCRKLLDGGTPVLALSQESDRFKPAWYLLVLDTHDEVWRVTTASHPIARRLSTVQKIYQVARDAGQSGIFVPVGQKLSRGAELNNQRQA